ncbi:MAG TPA: hypothetical protein VG755_11850, partial [Nannocystaceae bacterium]|nr:hypothetical protein [Nannocystaceae bacterium]
MFALSLVVLGPPTAEPSEVPTTKLPGASAPIEPGPREEPPRVDDVAPPHPTPATAGDVWAPSEPLAQHEAPPPSA